MVPGARNLRVSHAGLDCAVGVRGIVWADGAYPVIVAARGSLMSEMAIYRHFRVGSFRCIRAPVCNLLQARA